MQLESLKIFCDVVHSKSFSKGAEENKMSQSSASHIVSELERRLGVKLIDRTKRPMNPTPQGRIFYEGCREILTRYAELEAEVRAFGGESGVSGTVRIAAIYSVGLHPMSQWIERFQAQHPGTEVRLEYQHPAQVVEEVQEGHADLGIISFPRRNHDLAVHLWREEPMVLAVHPAHRLAGAGSISVRELDGSELVGFDSELAIRRAIDKFLKQHGVAVTTTLGFDNIESIKAAIQDLPSGAAILPEPTLARERAAGTLVAVPFSDARLTRPIAIIHRRGDLPLPASRFLKLLLNEEPASPNGSAKRLAVGGPSGA